MESSTASVMAASVAAPAQSSCTAGWWGVSRTIRQPANSASAVTVPNRKNMGRQLNASMSGPPMTRPIVGAPVMANWNQPMAVARWLIG